MGKNSASRPAPVDDFLPFYLKKGMLWVPYISDEREYLHVLTPAMTFKGIGYALTVLGGGGQVVPFTLRALRERRG